jgi:hypothetical protein
MELSDKSGNSILLNISFHQCHANSEFIIEIYFCIYDVRAYARTKGFEKYKCRNVNVVNINILSTNLTN